MILDSDDGVPEERDGVAFRFMITVQTTRNKFMYVFKLEFDCDVSHTQRKLRSRGDRARRLPRMKQLGAVETNVASVVANVAKRCQPGPVIKMFCKQTCSNQNLFSTPNSNQHYGKNTTQTA